MQTYYYELRNNESENSIEATSDRDAIETLDEMFDIENVERIYVKESKGIRTVHVPMGTGRVYEEFH